ncbi:hypothetical protein KCU79_g46, partial [Aureobasidium melanogenum]
LSFITNCGTSEYVSCIRSAVFAYNGHTPRMLTNRCEVLADQYLAFVFQILVKHLQDFLSVAERKSIATPALDEYHDSHRNSSTYLAFMS